MRINLIDNEFHYTQKPLCNILTMTSYSFLLEADKSSWLCHEDERRRVVVAEPLLIPTNQPCCRPPIPHQFTAGMARRTGLFYLQCAFIYSSVSLIENGWVELPTRTKKSSLSLLLCR